MTTPDAPTGDQNRLDFLDILRGIAVLAIFVVNIKAMFAPFAFYANATLWPGPHDVTVAALQDFLITDKWRTVFTMLFGAGLALIAARSGSRGASSLGLLTRRLIFLGLFGLIHILLIWNGDILFIYAASGLLAMFFRNAGAGALLRWSLIFIAVAFVWNTAFSIGPALDPAIGAEIAPFLWGTDPQALADARAAMLGGVDEHVAARLYDAREYLLFYFLIGGHWLETLAIMLAGMWAYRAGFFSPGYSKLRYATIAAIGLGAAAALDATRWRLLFRYDWSFEAYSFLEPLNRLDGYFGAAGWSAAIGLAVAAGWRSRAFSAAGRMAFTNYIACSLIGTTLAYGHGFGLFGALTNLQLMGIVAATWAAILIWSPLWLSAFRFGPLEWVWRSLTYGRAQPFRR